jgi:predicted nucleic acid-binding Zn ribbon protein
MGKRLHLHALSHVRDEPQKKGEPPTYHVHCHLCGKDAKGVQYFIDNPTCEKKPS